MKQKEIQQFIVSDIFTASDRWVFTVTVLFDDGSSMVVATHETSKLLGWDIFKFHYDSVSDIYKTFSEE